MTTKKTERDFYNEIKELLIAREDIVEFCEKKITQLDNKKSANSEKAKEKVQEREQNKNVILNVLAEKNDWATLKDIMNANDLTREMSNQKITNLLTELKKDNLVERKEDKRVVFYKLV